MNQLFKTLFLLGTIISSGCGFKKIGNHYFDGRCHRDVVDMMAGKSCGKGPPSTTLASVIPSSTVVCVKAINPRQCILEGIEKSVWATPFKEADIVLNYSFRFQTYYEFLPDGRFRHYIVYEHPFLPKKSYELREGQIQLSENDFFDSLLATHTVDFQIESSSCEGEESVFALFDQNNKVNVNRDGDALQLSWPDLDIEAESQNFNILTTNFLSEFVELFAEAVFAPFTPQFWKEVVTSPLEWDESHQAHLADVIADSDATCFSQQGFQNLESQLRVPAAVQLILLNR